MAYKALYRQFRPENFSEVVGQKAIVETLRNSILNDRIAHAYLFCGPRGTGKTSIAKIFAKAVNCEDFHNEPCNTCDNCLEINNGTHPDVIEMDAASNNSVDNVRDIIDKCRYSPLRGRYKVYIIDEAHNLSGGAFNALLKTLEEPPEHVIFILATTEPLKIPSTIISRCQRFDFGKITDEEIVGRMKKVCDTEGIQYEDSALYSISRLSLGGLRDALSILDQCVSYAGKNITSDDVAAVYGLINQDELTDFFSVIKDKDSSKVFEKTGEYYAKGADIQRLNADCLDLVRQSAVYSVTRDAQSLTYIDKKSADKMASLFTTDQLVNITDYLLENSSRFKYSDNAWGVFELSLLKIMSSLDDKEEVVVKKEVKKENVEPRKKEKNKTFNSIDDIKDKLLDIGLKKEEVEEVSRETFLEEKQISMDELMEVLVKASKEQKNNDNAKWAGLDQYRENSDYQTESGWLVGSKIVASSEEEIILGVLTGHVAGKINSSAESGNINKVVEEILGRKKYVLAISADAENEMIEEYKKRRKAGNLPSAKTRRSEVKKEGVPVKEEPSKEEVKEAATEENNQEDETITKLNNLFGEGNFDTEE